MRDLVIFGTTGLAELLHFFLTHDSEYSVKAFTVDREFLDESNYLGLPVVPFDEVTKHFPPSSFDMAIAIGPTQINGVRKEKFFAAKDMGYKMASYVSSRSSIWNTEVGENSFVFENSVIQPFVEIGNNVIMWSTNHVGYHSVIHDHVFISAHVVIGGGVEIGEQCFLGLNSTIRDHVKVGKRCLVGAGSLVLTDSPPDGFFRVGGTPRLTKDNSTIRL